MKIIFLLLIFSTSVLAKKTSYIPSSKLLHKGGYELSLSGDYFKTSKNVDKDGKKTDLPSGAAFNRSQFELSGFYGATDEFQIGVGIRGRRNSSTSLNSNNEKETISSSGLQSTFLSMKYAFKPVKKLQYTLEGMFRYTPYVNKEVNSLPSDQDLVLGDDGSEYSGGGSVTYSHLDKLFFTTRGGIRKPGVDLSSEFYWQLEGAIDWKSVALLAGADGVISMKQDPHGGEPGKHPRYNTGMTALYNSVNRDWIAPYLGLNVALGEKWRVEFKGSQVVTGHSTDLGTSFSLAIIRRADKEKINTKDVQFKSYDIEVSIVKVSPKKGYVSIDGGLSKGISKGLKMDFFEFDYLGGNVLVASGVVIEAKAETSIVKLTHKYNSKIEVKEGLVGRSMLK